MSTSPPMQWGRLLIVFLFLFSTFSCTTQEPIRVGFVANLTGPNAALGVDGRDGALLAVEKINSEGGLKGRPLELVMRDDLGTLEGARFADRELINDEKVSVVIGHMTSNTMMGTWREFKDSGVIFISPTVSTPELAGMHDNFFRLIPVNSDFSKKMAAYVVDELGLRHVAIFYDTDNISFTGTFRDGFADTIVARGGTIVLDYGFSSSAAPDFKSVLATLKGQELDGLCIVASAVDTALIAQQARLQGLDVQLLTANWALTEDLIENGGRAVDGILTVVAHDENNLSPAYIDFAERFQARFGRRPTFAAGYGFESVLVLAAALQHTGGDMQGLAEALLQTQSLSGVNGNISFDPYGDVVRTLFLITVRDGQFVTEKTFAIP